MLQHYWIMKDFKLWSFSLPFISLFQTTFSIFLSPFRWLLQAAERRRWMPSSLTQYNATGTRGTHSIVAVSWQGEPTALPSSTVSLKSCTKLSPLSSSHISHCNCITNRCADTCIQGMGHRPCWLSPEDILHRLLPSTEGTCQEPALLAAELAFLPGSAEVHSWFYYHYRRWINQRKVLKKEIMVG